MDPSSHNKECAVTILFSARTGAEREFLQVMETLVEEIGGQEGCVHTTLARSLKDANSFVACFLWDGHRHFNDFMSSEAFRVMLGASRTLGEPARFVFLADASKATQPVPCSGGGAGHRFD